MARSSAVALVLALVAVSVAAPTLESQDPGGQPSRPAVSPAPTPALGEELQVTSVDLWVAVPQGGLGAWLSAAGAGPRLEPADFALRVDGRPVEIAAITMPAAIPDPRRVVVFFDAVTSDQASLRWAASRLSERAAALVTLGDVEVVLADPDPRVVAAATRDAGQLATVLGDLALFEGTDAAIPLLRDRFLAEEERADAPVEAEVAAAYVEEETALVLRQQDLLLRHLIETGPTTRGGRVLIYVSQGFDPRPQQFYFAEAEVEAEGPLATESEGWIRSLAAYGWTCLPLVYEDRRALLRRGFRIGKWRLFGLGGQRDKGSPYFVPLGASHEAERDVEKAAAYLELADGALERGEHDAAADAYLRAIHHFYGDPRTQERQAYAWLRLASALRGSGEPDRARWAMANALELDPSIEVESSGAGDAGDLADLAELAQDISGLERLATETGGLLLADGASLTGAIQLLSTRRRLTFTLVDASSGRLLSIELALGARRVVLGHARWTRSGTPERVASSRLRLFLDEIAAEPSARGELRVRLSREERTGATRASIALRELEPSRLSRVMIGVLGEYATRQVAVLESPPAAGAEPGLWTGGLDLDEEILAAAIYVEDVASGEWTVEALTVEDR